MTDDGNVLIGAHFRGIEDGTGPGDHPTLQRAAASSAMLGSILISVSGSDRVLREA
ncbi:hypothetical protein [Rhodococcus koreensis]|uniref:hypothetical protein n=1 Tax=Rhodococcus koreensis TaxID=99653 RepID=UPI00366E0C34